MLVRGRVGSPLASPRRKHATAAHYSSRTL